MRGFPTMTQSGRHVVIWEYAILAAFEAYKNDPYYKGVFTTIA